MLWSPSWHPQMAPPPAWPTWPTGQARLNFVEAQLPCQQRDAPGTCCQGKQQAEDLGCLCMMLPLKVLLALLTSKRLCLYQMLQVTFCTMRPDGADPPLGFLRPLS